MIGHLFALGMALLSLGLNTLTIDGAITAYIMAMLLLFRGEEWLLIMVGFFILGSIVTRIGRKRKAVKQKTRRYKHVIGNGIVPILFAVFGDVRGFVGSVAAACSDTFSSEIGMLSKERPVLITTFKPVEKGTDGGITKLGYLAGFLGALSIGIISFYFFKDINLIISSIVGGIVGTTVDSIVGALWEGKYFGNMTTNMIGTLAGGGIAWIL